ncbi:MAG: cache domain-containing protein, partial [Campylobacterota bacterium]|nr:cache domain-containing protein [Campylobacterota bacterium]
MNKKTISIILFVFIFINAIFYKITDINSTQRIQANLEQSLQKLKTHYEILLSVQNTAALTLYDSTTKDKVFIDIFSKARDSSKEQQKVLRDKLQAHLKGKYRRAKMKGVLQYHFVFPDNIVFLRMHKPSKFGDDLTDVRDDFRVVNKTKKPIRGFTQGRTAHGFRNTFPVFDFDGKHLGAMEVSFSSDSFQQHLTQVSHIHTHFLVDKHIFDTKAWSRDDMVLRYQQSAEHKDYMITMTNQHTKKRCIVENGKRLQSIKDDIAAGIEKAVEFSTFVKHEEDVVVVSFLPIQNIQNKTVAWLVSYEKSEFIKYTLNTQQNVRIFAFLFTLIIVYFVFRQQQLLSNEKNLSDELKKSNSKLEKSNENLEQKIEQALNENIKQLETLQQQSKLASMGEMIGAIAHQWRQPLNEVSISIQNTKYDFKNGEIDEAYIKTFIDQNKKVI